MLKNHVASEPGSAKAPEKERLQKLLAHAGLASRRVVEEMIVAGRITVNGQIATLGMRANANDVILVDAQPVTLQQSIVTFLLHKPEGVLSTASDDRGRQTVVDLIECEERIYPIGRLDANTTGLILVSNDGDLAYRLTHPRFGVNKKYVARLRGDVGDDILTKLRDGVMLEDGLTAPADVKKIASKSDETVIEITIHEGRNRQIRRMADTVGHPVISLQRIQIGPLADSTLKPGESRQLNASEIHQLNLACEQENVSSRRSKIN